MKGKVAYAHSQLVFYASALWSSHFSSQTVDAAEKWRTEAHTLCDKADERSELWTKTIDAASTSDFLDRNLPNLKFCSMSTFTTACIFDLTLVVEDMLDTGEANIDERDADGRTPIFHAIMCYRFDRVKVLIRRDANLNAHDDRMETPHHIAADDDFQTACRMIVDGGGLTTSQGSTGRMPLHAAAEAGSEETARLLLERGADINAQTNNGSTPLHLAAMACSGRRSITRLLLDHGAHADDPDKHGRTPLHLAVQCGHERRCRTCLDTGIRQWTFTHATNTAMKCCIT